MKKEVLRIEGITVEKDEIIYLDNLSLWIAEGEVLGLIAANQHGLEELIDIILENNPLRYGQVYFDGQLVNDYIRGGRGENKVCVIDNRSRLIPELTVADNTFVLRKGFRKYVIDDKVLEKQVQQVLDELGTAVRADQLVRKLSAFERCVVELIKAVMSGTKLIIIREISEMISYGDLQKFYQLINYYKEWGITFLYIGHHHEDVFQICTRFMLYESGEIVKIFYPEDMDEEHIAPFVQPIEEKSAAKRGSQNPVLELKEITSRTIRELSCVAFSGECLTILDKDHTILYDLVGILTGEGAISRGEICLAGTAAFNQKQIRRMRDHILVVPENPVRHYLFKDQSYLYNLCFQVDKKIGRSMIPKKVKQSIIKEWQEQIGTYINAPDLSGLPIKALYDLVYYRVLLYRPRVAVLMQPFSGGDMYLRVHIANLIMKLKEKNIAVIVLTSYVADALAVTDQLVLVEGGRRVSEQTMLDNQFIQNNYYKDRFVERTGKENK